MALLPHPGGAAHTRGGAYLGMCTLTVLYFLSLMCKSFTDGSEGEVVFECSAAAPPGSTAHAREGTCLDFEIPWICGSNVLHVCARARACVRVGPFQWLSPSVFESCARARAVGSCSVVESFSSPPRPAS